MPQEQEQQHGTRVHAAHSKVCWPHGNEHAACRALGACDGLINSGRCWSGVCV